MASYGSFQAVERFIIRLYELTKGDASAMDLAENALD